MGYYAVRVSNIGMSRASDREVFEYALENNMVIVTMDMDFGAILALVKASKPSVILLRLRDPSPENVNRLLKGNLRRIEEQLLKGAIIVIEDLKIRVRRLPIQSLFNKR